MSFFGDLRNTTKATFGAVGKGVELLSFAAEELNKSAEILVFKTECYKLETELRNLKKYDSSDYDVDECRSRLIEAYRQAIREVSDIDRPDFALKLDALLVEESLYKIKVIDVRIKYQTQLLEKSVSLSPALKVKELSRLKLYYSSTLNLAKKISDKLLAEESSRKIAEIECKIVEVEKLRYEVKVEEFSSGLKKSIIRKYDGSLHGVSQFWYENGELYKEMCYSNGRPDGHCAMFRENGSNFIEIEVEQKSLKMTQQVYLKDGMKIIDFFLLRGSGEVSIWLWNGVLLGTAKYSEGRFSRLPFFFGILIRPKVWFSLFNAYKDIDQREYLNEMVSAAYEYKNFSYDFSR